MVGGYGRPDLNEALQQMVDPEKQTLFSFYEKVNHTPLEQVQDERLRGGNCREVIVDSELRAFFENGVYDPDGHPGNWLIDSDKREIVRIDYAQLRTTPEGEREAFKRVFAGLIKSEAPFFLRSLWPPTWPLSLESTVDRERLVPAIQSASSKVDFTQWEGPQEKLFALRNAIQDELSDAQRIRVQPL